jgi:hypothetical protein
MIALVRYLGADVLRSQRFLAPIVIYIGALAIVFSGDPGAPPSPWAATVLVAYPVAAWLALTVAHAEEPAQRTVTVASAGSWRQVLGAVVVLCVLIDLGMAVLATVVPLIGSYSYSPAMLLNGFLAHAAAALTGSAIGLVCARPVVQRVGWSLVLVLGIVLITALQPWLPPVGAVVAALGRPEATTGVLVALYAAVGAVLLAVAGMVTVLVAERR